MNLYNIIYNKIYLPLNYKIFYWYNPLKILKHLLLSQYWSSEQFKQYNEEEINKLKKILERNSYYKQFKTYEDLCYSNIKTKRELTKEEIRANIETLKQKNNGRAYKMSTSGSTGFPLTIYLNSLAAAYREAGRLRFKQWWGIDFSAKWVFLWGRSAEKKTSLIQKIFKYLNPFSGRGLKISIFDLNAETIHHYYNAILKHKPQYIKGYKSALLQFAKLLNYSNLNGKALGLKLVISTSEVLMPQERKLIEACLGCKVANEYGAVEAGLFAYECPYGSMHIFEEAVLIYNNNFGELVSTELHNYSTPMINYKTGDVIKLSNNKCICGRTLRIIDSIEGRVDDTIIKPDGNELNHLYFYYLFKDVELIGYSRYIRRYKVIQENFDFLVFIEKDNKYNRVVLDYLRKRMINDIGLEIKIEFRIVESIPLDKSGKLRFFIRQKPN